MPESKRNSSVLTSDSGLVALNSDKKKEEGKIPSSLNLKSISADYPSMKAFSLLLRLG